MSLPVVYIHEARDDLNAVYADYEAKLAGLGDRFLAAVRDGISRFADAPMLYGVVDQDVRAAPLKRFPHIIFYRVETDRTLIVTVQDGRRSWASWQGRV